MSTAVAPAESATAAPRVLGGRYHVTRLLKKGHGVEPFLATDEADLPVVIKTSSRDALSVGAQMRLEHEAAALRQIRSPFVAPLIELGRHEDLLYLVMPLVKGLTLEQRLQQGRLTALQAAQLAVCLFEALREVHDQAVLHRDLKPANIIIEDSG